MLTKFFKNVCRAVVEIYTEFSSESTIHGIKYTTQGKSTTERIVWAIIIIIYLLFALQLVKLHYDRRASGSMSNTIISQHYPIWKLKLPTVSFCPNTIVAADRVRLDITSRRKIYIPSGLGYKDFERALKYLREVMYPTNHYGEELDKLQQILSANRMSILDLLVHVSPNCSELMILCRFEEKITPCDTIVKSVVTPYGICCIFNYQNIYETRRLDNVMNNEGSVYFGDHHVLSVLMRPKSGKESVSSILYGDGVRVLILGQRSYPGTTSQQLIAPLGCETEVRLSGTSFTSSEEILRLPPEVRQCSTGQFYRTSNCYAECQVSIIKKLCGCLPFYVIGLEEQEHTCNLSHISCLANYRFEIESSTSYQEQCLCRAECESENFNVASSTIPLNAAQYSLGSFYKAVLEVPNATVVHITFASQSGVLQRRELLLSMVDLISSLGGIFGLFLGCSFISVIEIIHFLIIGLLQKLQNSKPK